MVFGDEDNTIRLHGCVACICADSSVTVVVLEGFRKLYTVPGRGARLTSLAVRADDLLLTYDDGKARVWDLRSQELRRSIATDQAQALVEDGKGWWSVKTIEPYNPLHSGTTGVLSQLAAARGEAAATLLVDFRRAIEAAARPMRGGMPTSGNETSSAVPGGKSTTASLQPPAKLRTEPDSDANAGSPISLGSPAARKAVNIVRPLLPVVYPTGLDADIDAKLAVLLDLDEPGALNTPNAKGGAFHVGLLSSPDALMVAGTGATSGDERTAKQAWKLSSRLTTTRLLIASALLRVLGNVSELADIAEDLQRFVDDDCSSRRSSAWASVESRWTSSCRTGWTRTWSFRARLMPCSKALWRGWSRASWTSVLQVASASRARKIRRFADRARVEGKARASGRGDAVDAGPCASWQHCCGAIRVSVAAAAQGYCEHGARYDCRGPGQRDADGRGAAEAGGGGGAVSPRLFDVAALL